MQKFSAVIDYNTQYPDFITLRVTGEVRIHTLEPIEKHLENLYPVCKGKKVLLDLTETGYVSSNGWSLFLIAHKRVQEAGGRFLLAGMNTDVQNAFELLEFQEFMENYPSPAEAFQAALKEELFLPREGVPRQKIGYF
jgi:anti-anti-sigma factor